MIIFTLMKKVVVFKACCMERKVKKLFSPHNIEKKLRHKITRKKIWVKNLKCQCQSVALKGWIGKNLLKDQPMCCQNLVPFLCDESKREREVKAVRMSYSLPAKLLCLPTAQKSCLSCACHEAQRWSVRYELYLWTDKLNCGAARAWRRLQHGFKCWPGFSKRLWLSPGSDAQK